MVTSSQFADAIGRKKLADALGLKATAVSNAVVRGWFPSSWFLVASELALEAGVECPPALFGMYPNTSQYVNLGNTVAKRKGKASRFSQPNTA